jgi:ribosomal protein L11 methyltransferase
MAWIEIKVKTMLKHVEALSALLTELGALAITTQDAGDQPLYEPSKEALPLWENHILIGLFDDSTRNLDEILLTLLIHFPQYKFEINSVPDLEWTRVWMEDLHPMQFGKRLFVVPSFKNEQLCANQVVLDPGLAFGTGKHPTTALCLQWLDEHIAGGEMLVDYGCGSGILAIAALKLGAKKAYAIDNDPQAILATQENAKKNEICETQLTTLFPENLEIAHADILIANILANPLIEFASKFADILVAGGKLALSGILENRADDVVNAYQPFFTINHIEKFKGWVRIDAYK